MRLDDTLLAEISRRGVVRTYPKRTILVHEGDDSDSLYIVLQGSVRVYTETGDGKSYDLDTLGPGEYFGELALDGGPRAASVVTLEPTKCTLVAGRALREFIVQHPDFGTHLIHRLIGRIREMTEDARGLAHGRVYHRLIAELTRIAVTTVDGRRECPRLTQVELANRLGTARPMVTRLLRDLRVGGYIAVEGKQIILLKKLPANW